MPKAHTHKASRTLSLRNVFLMLFNTRQHDPPSGPHTALLPRHQYMTVVVPVCMGCPPTARQPPLSCPATPQSLSRRQPPSRSPAHPRLTIGTPYLLGSGTHNPPLVCLLPHPPTTTLTLAGFSLSSFRYLRFMCARCGVMRGVTCIKFTK